MKSQININKFVIGYLSLVLIGSILAPQASAQVTQQRSMTIVPPSIQQSFDPGMTKEGIMKVVNDSDETLTFNAVIRDFIVDNNQGTPKVLPPNALSDKYSAATWIGVSPTTFTVLPHQKQELSFFIKVPANARPGGHYAAVMYTPVTNVASGVSGAQVETQIGTLFYILVNGPIHEGAHVTNFTANPFQEYGPVTVKTTIQNNGDYHIRPEGTITLSNTLGQRIEVEHVDLRNIFPEASLLYTNVLGKKLMIGHYTARFYGSYGLNNNLPLLAVVSFWVFPWKITLILLLIIILVIVGGMYMKKKRKEEKHMNTPEASPEIKSPQQSV